MRQPTLCSARLAERAQHGLMLPAWALYEPVDNLGNPIYIEAPLDTGGSEALAHACVSHAWAGSSSARSQSTESVHGVNTHHAQVIDTIRGFEDQRSPSSRSMDEHMYMPCEQSADSIALQPEAQRIHATSTSTKSARAKWVKQMFSFVSRGKKISHCKVWDH